MDLHRMRLEQAPARSRTSFSNRGGVLALLSGLRPRLRFRSDEGVVDRRQRVEIRGLAAEVPGLIDVPAGLVGLTEPIEVLAVLLVRLLELGRGLVVVLFRERDDAVELVGLLALERVPGGRGPGPELGRLALRRREVLLLDRHPGEVVMRNEPGVVLDLLREVGALGQLQAALELDLRLVG